MDKFDKNKERINSIFFGGQRSCDICNKRIFEESATDYWHNRCDDHKIDFEKIIVSLEQLNEE